MKTEKLLVIVLMFIAIGCSNPSVEYASNPIRTNQGQAPEEGNEEEEQPFKKLFTSSSKDGQNGFATSGFETSINGKDKTYFNFMSEKPNANATIVASDIGGGFTIHSKSELIKTPDSSTLKTLFSESNKFIKIMSPVEQDSTRGVDTGIANNASTLETRRIAFLWSFKKSQKFFGATFIDLESSQHRPALLRTFDCYGNKIDEFKIQYPDEEIGNRETHFIGIQYNKTTFCYVSMTVGDHATNLVQHRAIAVDDFYFGN